jgi:hypothetical protein
MPDVTSKRFDEMEATFRGSMRNRASGFRSRATVRFAWGRRNGDGVLAGPDGIRMLVVGGIPGRGYEPWHRTELGAPDPSAD